MLTLSQYAWGHLGTLTPWMTPEFFNKVSLGFDGIAKQNEHAVILLLFALAQVGFAGSEWF